jgi:hypothetical protein
MYINFCWYWLSILYVYILAYRHNIPLSYYQYHDGFYVYIILYMVYSPDYDIPFYNDILNGCII